MIETEAAIQSWFEANCRAGELQAHIDNREEFDAAAQRAMLSWAPAGLYRTIQEALVRSADTVLQRLAIAELVCCNTDISCFEGDVLKPDLVLMDRDRGRFVVVELKKSHQTERQAITELMAYGQAIEYLYPGAPVAFVLVSHDWRPLLDYAVVKQIVSGHHEMLALKIEPCAQRGFRLIIRTDELLRDFSDTAYPPQALTAETISYDPPKPTRSKSAPLEVANAFSNIARQGERSGASGFALVCRSEPDYGNGYRIQWHITVFALDPYRLHKRADESFRRRMNPITAFLRDGTAGDDGSPWDWSMPAPDPGAAMELIYHHYRLSGSTGWSHDNQRDWHYVRADPWQGECTYVAFEAWGVLGELVRKNAARVARTGSSIWRFGPPFQTWRAPGLWIPSLDIVTGDDPLPGGVLSVSSCHALGVVFHNWIVCAQGRGEGTLRYVLASARMMQAIRVIAAMCETVPALNRELPPIGTRRGHPDLHGVLALADWVQDRFVPECWLRFAFHLGYQVPQQSRQRAGEATQDLSGLVKPVDIEWANAMLDRARTANAAHGADWFDSAEHYELEHHLQGQPLSCADLVDPSRRAQFIAVVTGHHQPYRYPTKPVGSDGE
jgi:hypothetical protein